MTANDEPSSGSRTDDVAAQSSNSAYRAGAYGVGDEIRDGMDLGETFRTLWHGKWWIVLTVALTLGAAVAYLWLVPPTYEAFAVLEINTEQVQIVPGPSGGVEEVIGLKGRRVEDEMMIIAQSLDIRRRVAETLINTSDIADDEQHLSVLYDEDGLRYSPDDLVFVLEDYITVVPEGEELTGIRVVAESRLPAEAALIANTVAQEYINRTRDVSRGRLMASTTFLEEQEEKLRRRLLNVEDSLRDFMTTRGAAALDQEASQTVAQIAQLEALRDASRIDKEMLQATLESMEEELGRIEPNLVQRVASNVEAELRGVQEQITTLELRAEDYYQRQPSLRENPDSNPELIGIVSRLNVLRDRAAQLSEQYVNEVLNAGGVNPSAENGGLTYVARQRRQIAESRISLRAVEAKETALDQRLREYRSKLQRIPSQSIELARLERDRRSAESLYTYLVEKLQETTIALESEIGYAEVIRPAATPDVPVRPNRPRALILSVIFGFMAGGSIVVTRRNVENRIHDSSDLAHHGYEVVAWIPDLKNIPVSEVSDDYADLVGSLGKIDRQVTMLTNPLSVAAEAYRRLSTTIRYASSDGEIKVLLVTGPEPEDGKTTTAVNLALALAETGVRTAVVDMDLRLPRVHSLLNIDNDYGVTDLLKSQGDFRLDAFRSPIPDFSAIPAGTEAGNPSRLLGSGRLQDLVDQMRDKYDLVIIDTPPVLAFNDARAIATLCDAALLVVAAGKTQMRSLEHSLRVLQHVGTRVLGCVLNMSPDRHGLEYYARYAYKYDGSRSRRNDRSRAQGWRRV